MIAVDEQNTYDQENELPNRISQNISGSFKHALNGIKTELAKKAELRRASVSGHSEKLDKASRQNSSLNPKWDPKLLSEEERKHLIQYLHVSKSNIDSGNVKNSESSDNSTKISDADSELAATPSSSMDDEYSMNENISNRLDNISSVPGNKICADCSDYSSTWSSLTFGVFLCIQCAGAHRSLGVDVSFTQSITLDSRSWSNESVSKLENGGNMASNAILEYHVPSDMPKPGLGCPGRYRQKYISAKYADRMFTAENNPTKEPLSPVFGDQSAWTKIAHERMDSTYSTSTQSEVEYVGVVSVQALMAQLGRNPKSAGNFSLKQQLHIGSTTVQCVFKLGSQVINAKVSNRSEGANNIDSNAPHDLSWNGSDELQIAVTYGDSLYGKKKISRFAILNIGELCDSTHPQFVWVKIYRYDENYMKQFATNTSEIISTTDVLVPPTNNPINSDRKKSISRNSMRILRRFSSISPSAALNIESNKHSDNNNNGHALTKNHNALRRLSLDARAAAFFKSKMSDTLMNIRIKANPALEVIKQKKNQHPTGEPSNLQKLGYKYNGKLLLCLSFFDLRGNR